jgi:hypothetical protein
MSVHRHYLPLVMATVLCGCHSFGPLVKRDSELNCPTDIRRTVPWCAGEDAIFRCPCGPSDDFYGHKPTSWRTWPAPAAVWRDSYCGGQLVTEGAAPVSAGQEEVLLQPSIAEPIGRGEGSFDEDAPPPSLEELPPTSSVMEPRTSVGYGIQPRLAPRNAAAGVVAAPLPHRDLPQVTPEPLPQRRTSGGAPAYLGTRRVAAVTPVALPPRRAATRPPTPLSIREGITGPVPTHPSSSTAVTEAAYSPPANVVASASNPEQPLVKAVHSEEAAGGTGVDNGAVLAVVELPPASVNTSPNQTTKLRRRSLLDAFIRPAYDRGGEETPAHNWNLVR